MKKLLLLWLSIFSLVSATPNWIHEWKTLSTENFDIIYNPKYTETAVKVARIAESSYIPVSKSLGYYPTKTSIILRTDNDQSNAFASPFPWRIELYVNQPVDNWLGANDDYLKTVFIHEFTHIVHKQKKSGFTSFVSLLVGQNYAFIHSLGAPLWFQEGIAVYNETKFTNSGRLRNPYQMALLDAAYNKTLWDYRVDYKKFSSSMYWQLRDYRTLYESNFYSRKDLPSGMYYDYGSQLIEDVSKKYGDGVWRLALNDYTYNPFFTLDIGLKLRLETYTKETIEELDYNSRKKFNKPKLQIENREDELVNYYNPRWGDDGLYVYKKSFNLLPQIVKLYEGRESEVYKYASLNDDNSFDVNYSRFIVSKYHVDPRYTDVIHNKLELLTDDGDKVLDFDRIFTPDIAPQSGRIVAIQSVPNQSSMLILSPHGEEEQRIELENTRFSNPRWSNDETMIVYTSINEESHYNIAIYDINAKTHRYVYEPNNFIDNNACFSDDDQSVFYNSDKSGIPNVWAIDIISKENYRVTDAQFSAMAPDVKDGKIAYITYTVNGYRVIVEDIDYTKYVLESEKLIKYKLVNEHAIKIDTTVKVDSSSYNPFKYMLPHSWGLLSDNDYLGFGFSGNDPLKHHTYSLYGFMYLNSGGLDNKNQKYKLTYGYNRFWPKVSLNFDYYNDTYTYQINELGFIYGNYYDSYLISQINLYFPLTLESGVYNPIFTPDLNYAYHRYNFKESYNYLAEGTEFEDDFTDMRFGHVSAGFRLSRLSYVTKKNVPNSGAYLTSSSGLSSEDLGGTETNFNNSSNAGLYVPVLFNYITLDGGVNAQYYNSQSTLIKNDQIQDILPFGYNSDDVDSLMYMQNYFFKPKLEVHLPLLNIEKRVFYFPIYIDYFSLDPFVETFITADQDLNTTSEIRGVGTTLSMAMSFFQIFDVNAKLYYSFDWDENIHRRGVYFYIN